LFLSFFKHDNVFYHVRKGDPFGDIFAAEFWPKVLAKIWATISEHQQTITGYLRLRPFDDAEAAQLEQFLCEETCRLEQAAALMGRAREFLKSSACSSPLAFRIARIVGEQRARAREHIFRRVAASVPNGLAGTLEDLLVVKPDENSSGLQAIKANPSKPSVDAMLTLLDKLRVIEATGVLGVDLLWLNGNYQRALSTARTLGLRRFS